MDTNSSDERQEAPTLEEIRKCINSFTPATLGASLMHGYAVRLLSLLDSQVTTHGFAPMDRLDDVCGAYTPDGYCWRPKKHPIHGAVVGMGLHECNTPAQGFNAEREKKVADLAATRMREACVGAVKATLTDEQRKWRDGKAINQYELGQRAAFTYALAALESLTLDQVEQKQ